MRSKLVRHPDTPCRLVTGIGVDIATEVDLGLRLTYTLTGGIAGLLIPAPAEPARMDGLWRHTCFEVFIMSGDGPAYREFNFSPSGAWAAYDFQAYRETGPLPSMPAPAITCRHDEAALELLVRLDHTALPENTRLRLGLSAVIEDLDGNLSYWALSHPPGKPDFHHTDAFALELNRP